MLAKIFNSYCLVLMIKNYEYTDSLQLDNIESDYNQLSKTISQG